MLTNLLIASVALVSHIAAAQLPAPDSAIEIKQAYLPTASIDASLLGPHRFQNANVTVEYTDTVPTAVELTIYLAKNCTAGFMCTQEIVEPISVRLPVTKVAHGYCGGTFITASRDLRPVDGKLQEIVMTDASTMLCDIYVPHATQVVYRTSFVSMQTGEEYSTTSSLKGEVLGTRLYNERQ